MGTLAREICKDGKPMTRVLFCGVHFPAMANYTREYLKTYSSIQVDSLPFDSIPDLIGGYDICVINNMRVNSDVIAHATRMKLIMHAGAGLQGVDIAAATKKGIKVGRIPGAKTGNAASCAEMAIYLILGLLRKQNEMQIAVRQKKLGEPIGDTLFGKTVLILGFGNIGIELAKRLRAFGVRIIATKRNWASPNAFNAKESADTNYDLVDEKGFHQDIYEFVKKSDIIVCCLAMNSETAGTINKTFLSSMKKGCVLVNISRGGLLDYEAVVESLKSGHLGGLGMDVAWTEPFDPEDPILKFPNVLLTPHVAGLTETSCKFATKVVGDVALQVHLGNPLTGIEIVN